MVPVVVVPASWVAVVDVFAESVISEFTKIVLGTAIAPPSAPIKPTVEQRKKAENWPFSRSPLFSRLLRFSPLSISRKCSLFGLDQPLAGCFIPQTAAFCTTWFFSPSPYRRSSNRKRAGKSAGTIGHK